MTPKDPWPAGGTLEDFIRRVVIAIAIVALTLLAWQVRGAFLIGFGGLVVATVLLIVARPVRRVTRMPQAAAVAVACAVIATVIGVAIWVISPAVGAQIDQLTQTLNEAIGNLDAQIEGLVPERLAPAFPMLEQMIRQLTAWSAALIGGLSVLILTVLAGVFFAAAPERYRAGTIQMFPPRYRSQVAEGLEQAATGLRAWLIGQIFAMLIITTGVSLGAWLIGLPSYLALGLIAGLFEFVPVVGPIVSAIPGLLIALTISPVMLFWTAVMYFVIQQVEANLLVPMVQNRIAHVPPAVYLLAFVAIALLFGIVGVILSAPMTVVAYVLIKHFHVKRLNAQPDERQEPKPKAGPGAGP